MLVPSSLQVEKNVNISKNAMQIDLPVLMLGVHRVNQCHPFVCIGRFRAAQIVCNKLRQP